MNSSFITSRPGENPNVGYSKIWNFNFFEKNEYFGGMKIENCVDI